jgi:hypothetical protein
MTRGVAPVATRTTSALTLCCVVSVVTAPPRRTPAYAVPLMISTPTSRTRVGDVLALGTRQGQDAGVDLTQGRNGVGDLVALVVLEVHAELSGGGPTR